MEFDAWSRIKSIWPTTRSFKAGPVPRYGTIVKARAGDLLEINLCDLRGRACARGTCRSLGFVRLQPSDEFLEICRRYVLLGYDQLRIGRKQCDRCEILQQVVAQIVDRAVDDMCAPMADTDCITVRRRVCDTANTDRSCGTGHILDQNRLAERDAHTLAHHTCNRIRRATCRERNVERDRTCRIALRAGNA